MKKSIRNKIAIMLALFGTIGQKTYANKLGYAIAGVATMGMIGMAGLCSFFYGKAKKAKDENNKKKYQESFGDGQHDIIVNRPSRNPNVDDLLKNKIKNILDNGNLNESKPSLNALRRFYNQACCNNGRYQFDDENVSEKDAVSIAKYDFDDDSDDPTAGTIYKFILENDKQVKVQWFKFEVGKGQKMVNESLVTLSE